MAVPKGKVSRARRDKRRSSHWKLETPGLVACPKCGALRLPHRMCKECGTYNGRQVVAVEAEYAKKRKAAEGASRLPLFPRLFACSKSNIHQKCSVKFV